MGWVSGLAVYAIVWWLTFLMILPIGVHRQEDVGAGHDPGAPVHAHIGRKLIINTLVATALFVVIFLLDYYDVVSFRDFRTPSSGRVF